MSSHHQNTEKIVQAMAEDTNMETCKISELRNINLSDYDCIGFASGIYYHNFHKSIIELVKETRFTNNQKVFTVYTCGINYINYARSIEKIIKQKECEYIGCFSCRGYDTFSFFEKIGGIAKNHPNNKDKENARKFIEQHKIGNKII